jgi:hypothetical protein
MKASEILMETSINERIQIIMNKLGYKSKRSFSLKLGISQTSFNDILKGAEPKFSTLEKIMKVEPLINAEWLLTGEGEPFKKEDGGKMVERIAGVDLSIEDLRREYLNLISYKNIFGCLTEMGKTYTTSEIAADLDMTAVNLNKRLEEMKVIRKENNRWLLCDEYLGCNYYKPHVFLRGGDLSEWTDYIVWTPVGRVFIYSLFSQTQNALYSEQQKENESYIQDIEYWRKKYYDEIEYSKSLLVDLNSLKNNILDLEREKNTSVNEDSVVLDASKKETGS